MLDIYTKFVTRISSLVDYNVCLSVYPMDTSRTDTTVVYITSFVDRKSFVQILAAAKQVVTRQKDVNHVTIYSVTHRIVAGMNADHCSVRPSPFYSHMIHF